MHALRVVILLGLTAVACSGEPAVGRSTGSASTDAPLVAPAVTPGVVRPGQSLMEHLDVARIVDYPATNLPADVAELSTMESARAFMIVPQAHFVKTLSHELPEPLLELFAARPGLGFWRHSTKLSAFSKDGRAPEVVAADGQPLRRVETLTPDLAEVPAFIDTTRNTVFSVGRRAPEGLRVLSEVDSASEFTFVERGRLRTGSDPVVAAVSGRFELGAPRKNGAIVRDGLLVPAPAWVEFELARWEADALEVSAGVLDRSWRALDGAIERVDSRSDGARFVLEVDGEPVWSHTLPAAEVGKGRVDARVDLSAWRGQPVRLTLRTEPGAGGDAVADYAVWTGLRAVGAPAASPAASPERAPATPNVVIVDIDTLRADRLAAYGGRGRAPNIDAWAAAHATAYVDSLSTSSWTLPATLSMLTGMAAHQHGVLAGSDALGPAVPTLATRLKDAGYETHAITTGAFLHPRYGGDNGFDIYETRPLRYMDWSDAVARMTEGVSERPTFLFLQTYAVHQPYPKDARFVDPAYDGPLAGLAIRHETLGRPLTQGRLEMTQADVDYCEALYDALVADMDTAVGELLDALRPMAERGELLLVFTSDHGEAFFEHEMMGHEHEVFEELLQVPLVIEYPDREAGTNEQPVSLVDLVPTVLDVVGLPADPTLPGSSLRTLEDGPRVRVAEVENRQAVRSETWKLVEKQPGQVNEMQKPVPHAVVELYDIREDPLERNDLSEARRGRVEELRRRYRWYLESYPPEAPSISSLPGAVELEQLRALGYLGDG